MNKNMWYIHIIETYPAIRKNEIMTFAVKCMELENMLTEINQVHKAKCHMFLLICGICLNDNNTNDVK
jgi:hypothetical protein